MFRPPYFGRYSYVHASIMDTVNKIGTKLNLTQRVMFLDGFWWIKEFRVITQRSLSVCCAMTMYRQYSGNLNLRIIP